MKQPFDEVLHELEQARRCVDEDLGRPTAVAGYLRAMLPARCHVAHDGAALPDADPL